ncbi:MAG: GNAT family N-acetyltransferase [Deltaproteobacteria bacterium]|nr:GNAT family N-acetyltransferase [Deltaproteobacteria bacterium]
MNAPSVEVIETEEGFDRLRRDWDRLFVADGRSVFQSFEWLRAWWRHFGEGDARRELHIALVVVDVVSEVPRRPQRLIVGIAPFFIERTRAFGVVGVRRLAFLGRPVSDYLDIIAAPAHRAVVVDALAQHLSDTAHAWDVCVLEDITERSPTATALQAALSSLGITATRFANERCPRTVLQGTWAETLAALKGDHRRELQRRRRKLEKHAPVELEIAGDAASIDADLEQFIAMHQEHWTSMGHTGALADTRAQRFHRDAAAAMAARGWTFMAFLRVHGRRVAVVYGFRFNNELAIYLTGARHESPELRQLSTGRVLASLVMEHATTSSLQAYDFMRGTEGYKYELGGVDVANQTLIIEGQRSWFSARRHRAGLLHEALLRRGEHERALWEHATGRASPLSSTSTAHVRARLGVVWRDGLRKLKHPERSLSAELPH